MTLPLTVCLRRLQDLLNDLNIGSNKHRIMEMAVSLALERHDPQRELTSRLISDLYGQLLNRDEMMEGFHGLLSNLPDLTLDTPDAPSVTISATTTSLNNSDYRAFISQFVFHRQRIQEFCKFLNHRHHKRDRKYSDCQLKF